LRAAKWQEFNQQFGGAAVDLSNAELPGADLSFTRLVGANLDGANLTGARFTSTDLRRSSLRGTRLDQARFSRANLGQAKLVDIRADQVGFDQSTLIGAELTRVAGNRWTVKHSTFRAARIDELSLTDGHFETLNLREVTGTRLHLAGRIGNRIELAQSQLGQIDWAIQAGDGLDLDEAQIGRFNAHKVLLRALSLRGSQIKDFSFDEGGLMESEAQGSRIERLRITRSMFGRSFLRQTTVLAFDLGATDLMEVAFDRCAFAKLDAENSHFIDCRIARTTTTMGAQKGIFIAGRLEMEDSAGFSPVRQSTQLPKTRVFVDGVRV